MGLPGGAGGKITRLPMQETLSIPGLGRMGPVPGSGRSPGGGHSNPFQYSCLETAMDRGAWWARVHRVAKSDTTEVIQHNAVSPWSL